MKIIYSLILILFTVSISKGQFVFTSANSNPIIGDNYIEYNADTTGVNPGTSGINQVWDFHSLILNTNLYVSHSFVSPVFESGGCWANLFPSATIEDSISQTYFYNNTYTAYSSKSYYNTSNFSISHLGDPGSCGAVYSNDTQFVYPFVYGSNYQNNSGSLTPCGCTTGGSDSLNKNYDAYGTLFLPGITYYNVARVVDFVKKNYSYGQGVFSQSFSYTYKWYVDSLKFPVLTISIEYAKKTILINSYNEVGINSLALNNFSLSLYPNPTNESAMLKFDNSKKENCTLRLYDTQGRLLRTIENITTGSIEIERQNLEGGFYFFRLQTNRQIIGTGKLIIKG